MTRYAQQERHALADLFDEVGPDAPTLCEGWLTRDLAAHLVVRERRPDAAVGLVLPALAGHLAHVQQSVRDGRQWPTLVQTVRSGPPMLMRPFDEQVNALEYFVHHEDVRRAQPEWEPRAPDPDLDAALWSRIPFLTRMVRGKVAPMGLVVDAPGYGSRVVRSGDPEVTLTGPPGELVLFLFGRQKAARVEAAGPPEAVERLRGMAFGV